MKALALDTAVTRFCIAVKNESSVISAVYDIGMKQSETLLPAIDELMKKAGVLPSELAYTALCGGPGSFTGLRLAFAALKALSHARNVPLYAIPTLEAYAFPYRALPFPVISAIDAKKNKLYCACFERGSEIVKAGDYTIENIAENIEKYFPSPLTTQFDEHATRKAADAATFENDSAHCTDRASHRHILCCGPDAALCAARMNALYEKLSAHSACARNSSDASIHNAQTSASARFIFTPLDFSAVTTDALFALAEKRIAQNAAPLADYDGPRYLRASEAEEKLHEQQDA